MRMDGARKRERAAGNWAQPQSPTQAKERLEWATRPHSLIPNGSKCHFATRNAKLLLSVPLGVVTSTVPVVAPVGTVVLISELETTLKPAAAPLKVMLVAPVRFVPKTITFLPTLPDVGSVPTNGPSPTLNLKAVPWFEAPPNPVS